MPKHVVSHLAFFLISLQIHTDALVDTALHKDYPARLTAFRLLQACHALSVLIFLINVYSKREGNEFCLKLLQTIDILLYLLPNIYNQFLFQKQSIITPFQSVKASIYQFLELEVYYFMINVNTLIIFLFLTYTSKFKSIVQFKGAIISDCGNYLRMDVWNNPKTADFMHTLKFEYFNIKMNLTDLLMAVYLCFRIFRGDTKMG
jgi:hypothetical protein